METVEGEEEGRRFDLGNVGVRWYHVGFALAFGLGTAIFPPSGVDTIAGWVGGAVGSFVTTFLLSGIVLLGVRSFDNWRPPKEPREGVPSSGTAYLLFLLISLQLFVFGTEISVGLDLRAMLYLLAPTNLLVSGVVLGDMLRLRGQGIEWETVDFGYPAVALVMGFVGGLGYWYRRGRARSEWYEKQASAEEDEGSATEDDPEETAAGEE